MINISLPKDKKKISNDVQLIIWKAIITHISLSFGFTLVFSLTITALENMTKIFGWLIFVIYVLISVAILLYFFFFYYLPILRFLDLDQVIPKIFLGPILHFSRFHQENESHVNSLDTLLRELRDGMDQEMKAKLMIKQAELDALQSQINPHFLYNTLEAIRAQAITEGVDEIANMTESLSIFFRYSISQRGSIVTLNDEMRNVENYFIIQKYRFDDKFSLIKKFDDDPDLLNYKLPKLTLQPIIENAIYHGLENKVGKGEITIRIIVTNNRLIIHIVDDGIGIEKTKLNEMNQKLKIGEGYQVMSSSKKSHGIALFNVNKRIKLNFGENFGLILYSTPGIGTDVEISLPLINDKLVEN